MRFLFTCVCAAAVAAAAAQDAGALDEMEALISQSTARWLSLRALASWSALR